MKIRVFLFFIILFNINLLNSYILISLGGCCTAAGVQRDLGLRKAAYPFDWMFSSFDSVYNAIKDDFKRFLSKKSLRVAEDNRIILDYYHLGFVHDFPTINDKAATKETETHEWAKIANNWKDSIKPIKAKYTRRIKRFKDALKSNDHVYLIRYTMSREEAIKMRDLISKKYKKSKFTIVAISSKEEDSLS